MSAKTPRSAFADVKLRSFHSRIASGAIARESAGSISIELPAKQSHSSNLRQAVSCY
ncbi:hypothetical protein [Tychonema sp. BBK16]|uniref:hypothetical protein n=1 Tax=Tychonema sp. BBK16 TaxID=2699888 RepID=UPI001F212F15|nr:hypothetical protein [Tychonema sp. BBK16]MCF6375845.1 hypothetical protein [Tychonema sp. BBK16]